MKIIVNKDKALQRKEEVINEILSSNRRELLIAFAMDRNKAPKEFRPQYEKEVDKWLESN